MSSVSSLSTLDLNTIIPKLVANKTSQLSDSLNTSKSNIEVEISGVGKLKSSLSTFKDSYTSFAKNLNPFKTTVKENGVVNDEPKFSIETKEGASATEFELDIDQLATSTKMSKTFSRDFANNFRSGTLNIDMGEDQYSIQVNAGDTLEQIRRNINKNNHGISASIVNTTSGYALTLNRGITGSEGTMALSFVEDEGQTSGTSLSELTTGFTTTQGKDAIIRVNGDEVVSSTNTFDQISGLTLNITGTTDNTNTVNLERDEDEMIEQIKTFKDAFNTVLSDLNNLGKRNSYTSEGSNYDGGELAGDATTRNIAQQLKSTVFSSDGAYSMGISFDKYGELQIDESKLKSAIENDYESVFKFFNGDSEDIKTGETGLIDRMNQVVDTYTKTGGILDTRTDRLNSNLSTINDRLSYNQQLIQKYEENMYSQYTVINQMIENANSVLSMFDFGTV